MIESEMKKCFNWKLAALVVGTVAGLWCGLLLLHRHNGKYNAVSLRLLAEEAERKNEQLRAGTYYYYYLQQRPDDTDVLKRLAMIQIKLAKQPWDRIFIISTLDQVLRREPDNENCRRLLIDQALHPGLERFNDAHEHLLQLIRLYPSEAPLHYKLARCEAALGNYAAAQESFRTAIRLAPTQLDAYVDLADLQRRRLLKPADALATLDKLVAANPRQARAWFQRANFLRLHGASVLIVTFTAKGDIQHAALTRAAADLAEAEKLAGNKTDIIDILHESLELAQASDRYEAARSYAARGMEADPGDHRFYVAGARLEYEAGRPGEAMTILRRGMANAPKQFVILWELVQLAIDAQNWTEAAELESQLRELGLPALGSEYLQGCTMVSKGQWLEAIHRFDKIRKDLHPWPLVLLKMELLQARCHAELHDGVQQEADLKRALSIDARSAPALIGFGEALLSKGEFARAFKSFRLAGVRSRSARFRAVQACILDCLGNPPQRRHWDEVEKLLAPDPAEAGFDAVELALLRADILLGRGQPERAAAHLTAAIHADPKNPILWTAHAALLQQQGKWIAALAVLDAAEKSLGDSLDLSLARVHFWSLRGVDDLRFGSLRGIDEAAAALRALSLRHAGTFTGKDWLRWTRGLADAWLILGQNQEAARLFALIAQTEASDLNSRFRLVDVSDSPADNILAEIRRIEGNDGLAGPLLKACALLRQARADGKKPPDEARRLLSAVCTHASNWSRVLAAEAEWAELSGRSDLAIRKYFQAIEAGEYNPSLRERLAALVRERGDDDEEEMIEPRRPLLSSLLDQ